MAIKRENKISASEFVKHFSDQVEDADIAYNESLQRLVKIRASRQGHQKRQLKNMLNSYGKNDERVLRQANRIVREKEMENYTNIAIDKNKVDSELVKDSYVLRGKVRAENSKGLVGFKVQLQDAKNNVIGKPVKTDGNGNYSVVVDIQHGEMPKTLTLAVLDKEGNQIHKDKLPILLKSDVVDTRDILLTNIDKANRSDERILKDVLTPVNTIPQKVKAAPKKTDIKKTPAKKVTKKLAPRKTSKKNLK